MSINRSKVIHFWHIWQLCINVLSIFSFNSVQIIFFRYTIFQKITKSPIFGKHTYIHLKRKRKLNILIITIIWISLEKGKFKQFIWKWFYKKNMFDSVDNLNLFINNLFFNSSSNILLMCKAYPLKDNTSISVLLSFFT